MARPKRTKHKERREQDQRANSRRSEEPSIESPGLPTNLRVRWKNFRSLIDTDWLEIKPVTIIVGANNTGKTSLISPLILLKQTLEIGKNSTRLATKGPYMNVGDYRDFVHAHDLSKKVTFSLRFSRELKRLTNANESKRSTMVQGHESSPSSFALDLCYNADEDGKGIELSSYTASKDDEVMLQRVRQRNGRYSLRKFRSDTGEGDIIRSMWSYVRGNLPSKFLFSGEDIMQRYFTLESKRIRESESSAPRVKVSRRLVEYISLVSSIDSIVTSFLSSISYLGPARIRPKRIYETTSVVPDNVGASGENVPNIIYSGNHQVLLSDINEWLKHFDLGVEVECMPVGVAAFSILVKHIDSGLKVNFADTGFGFSQILPLVVESIISDKYHLILAEQPEIHLNPKQQSRLADLFLRAYKSNKFSIIETHSEHLLLRMRRLVAEKKIPSSHIALYYVEGSAGKSMVRSIPIASNGHIDISNWPRGFFEENLAEAIALVQAQSSQKWR